MSDSFGNFNTNVPGFGGYLTPRTGKVLNRHYQLEDQLGDSTWSAYDQMKSLFYTIRFIPEEIRNSPAEYARIQSAVQSLAAISHPHLRAVLNLEDDPVYGTFLLLDHPVGTPLNRMTPGSLTPENILDLLAGLAETLDFIHNRGVFHLRVRPGNILVNLQNGVLTDYYLTDAVIGRTLEAACSRLKLNVSRSEQAYSGFAPEIWKNGPTGAWTDQYALAALAYELFAGFSPFFGKNWQELRNNILEGHPAPIPGLLTNIQKGIDRGLSVRPEDRFPSCAEFVQVLRPAKKESSKKKNKKQITSEPTGDQQTTVGPNLNPMEMTGSPLDQMKIYRATLLEEEENDNSKWLKLGITLASCLLILLASWLIFGGGGKNKPRMRSEGSRPGAPLLEKIGFQQPDRSALNEVDPPIVMKKKSDDNTEPKKTNEDDTSAENGEENN